MMVNEKFSNSIKYIRYVIRRGHKQLKKENTMDISEIRIKLKKLPDHLIPEVIDYIDFLLDKHGSKETATDNIKNPDKFTFDWEGGLSKLKDRYTSVDLQHKAGEWR